MKGDPPGLILFKTRQYLTIARADLAPVECIDTAYTFDHTSRSMNRVCP